MDAGRIGDVTTVDGELERSVQLDEAGGEVAGRREG